MYEIINNMNTVRILYVYIYLMLHYRESKLKIFIPVSKLKKSANPPFSS